MLATEYRQPLAPQRSDLGNYLVADPADALDIADAKPERRVHRRGGDGAWAELVSKSPAGRVGRPEEFAAARAFLASAHTGFITGQNLLLNGGSYPGTP